MATVVSCPDFPVLQRFSIGQLPGEEVDSIAGHVARCPHCIQTLDSLHVQDTLLEALSARPAAGEGEQTEAVRFLIEQLKARSPATADSQVAAAHTTTNDFAGEDATEESLEFLAPPEQPDEIGRLGPYRVLKLLGKGGMGIVFQAEDTHLLRRVALKVMRPRSARKKEARERFIREARAAAAIEHDHIVTIHQVGEANGVPFLAMSLLKGMSLDDRLEQTPILPMAEIFRIGYEVASGLAAAHGRGLIHRDIKPANIWLEERGVQSAEREAPSATRSALCAPRSTRVKILDVGLAKPIEEAGDLTLAAGHITQSGAVLGTPAYMAPEQARGDTVDARSDLFSLGIVLYRMCTGRLPFE